MDRFVRTGSHLMSIAALLLSNVSWPARAQTDGSAVVTEPARILYKRRGHDRHEVATRAPGETVTATLKRLGAHGELEFVVPERRKQRHMVPNDSLFADQWYLQNTQPAAIGANIAWTLTTGSSGTIVAVLDTGVRFDHPDLARARQNGKLLPGYDFVSGDGGSSTQFLTANDGDGRDPDPTDPGDWVDSNDKRRSLFANCEIENSSWHGTRVAGLIAAASNNNIGIAGTTWQTWILPVRVLGKCGGYDSDILDALRWAAGLPVSGVPDNPYPAKIINLSLGSAGICTQPYRDVVQELAARGVIVVASAGNSGGPVEEPANCPGVIAVAGLRHAGTKVGYSSLGPEVTLAAPAGNCVNLSGPCLFSLHTTFDVGRTTPAGPGYTDQFNTNLGTSFSAPLVAGVAALMHATNARLSAAHLRARLRESARPFPDGGPPPPPRCRVPTGPHDLQQSECVCTTDTCGAGMLHAPSAVLAAQRPIASIVVPESITPGATLTLDGTSTAACNRAIVAYRWTVTDVQGAVPPILSQSDQPTVQVAAPTSGSYTLRLTVTDDHGASDSGEITVTGTTATVTTPAPLAGPACPAPIAITPDSLAPVQPVARTETRSGGGALGGCWLALLALIYQWKPSSSRRNSAI